MSKHINFVVPAPPEYLRLYQKVIMGIVDPVRVYLPESTVSQECVADAVNVHFFNEPSYFKKKINKDNGIHVFTSHGMGDKQWRDGPKVARFDYICVSGPSWVKKMIRQGIPAHKVLMTGFPKLDPLFQNPGEKTKDGSKITVLYAPTHAGSAPCTSYPAFKQYLDLFPADMQVLSCAHPYHRKENMPVFDEFRQADAVISDGSSVIYEALALGLPVVFPDWLVKDAILQKWPVSFTAQIYREGIGYHAESFDEMTAQLKEAANKGLSEQDRSFIEGIFPAQLRGSSGKAMADALKMLAQ